MPAWSLRRFSSSKEVRHAQEARTVDKKLWLRFKSTAWRRVGLRKPPGGDEPLARVLLRPPDWHSLRVSGLICAGLLCVMGIIVLLSGKCKCRFRQKPSHRQADTPPLITPGSAPNY
ncbi:FXYD domain-containing ion transport regulator 3 isoform X1 [Diceros bicornis minor]|uniref:FXYD domain-containing ion transport regulator 3 isoform X1 n=1 Tax=Diceros bicornis minor TaxID=77932 RepID=UPI0026E93C1C|nr:FXYD domain-containing ion transport regulator 3 isoform X1 [Diceros bicornis minor]